MKGNAMMRANSGTYRAAFGVLIALLLTALPSAVRLDGQTVNTKLLSENGWYSDDTRADGSGSLPAGTNLVSPTLTDDPEATATGDPTHNSDINGQISFGPAPGAVPASTHDGAVRLFIDTSGSGKSQISHRKDDATGHGPGSGFGPGFTAEYSWMGDGTASVTASLKFGIKTADFGSTGVSPRTGENVWDKVLIYEPGNLNGGVSDSTWQTETVDYTTGKWWFFDRTAGAGIIGTPMTLSDMSTSAVVVGGGPKTVADVYALITAPGALITSVQFGIGSGNADGNVYVNQMETSVYRAGMTTTFGCTDTQYFNGFETDTFGWNVFTSPTFDATRVASGTNGVTSASGSFHAEAGVSAGNWGGYSGVCGCASTTCSGPVSTFPTGGYVTSIDIYLDVSGGYLNDTNFDFSSAINGITGAHHRDFIFNGVFLDSGDFTGPGGGGVDRFVIAASNNSPGFPQGGVDPVAITSTGWYTFEHHFYDSGSGVLACEFIILDSSGSQVASWIRSTATDVIGTNVGGNRYGWFSNNEFPFLAFDNTSLVPGPFDQNATPDVIFGSGNANGSFTVDRTDGIELALRAKLRFPASNIFKSNGDGTYTYNTGSGTSVAPNPEWAFEWSVNTDFDDSTGRNIEDLTYELGIDFDADATTNYLIFDPITPGAFLPYTVPAGPTVFWDHAIGDNTTPNGGGVSATDGPSYEALIAANNVAQNSWRNTFFDDPPFVFDPALPGRYDFYLAAFDGGVEVARTAMAVIVADGTSLSLEADPDQVDQDPGLAGIQIAVDLWLRNPDDVTVTGYQAFLAFDDSAMTYEGASSSYSPAPFGAHIQAIASAEVAAGELRLDGNTFGSTSGDARLATLIFTVTECDPVDVLFDLTQPFDSEASNAGSPLATALLDSTTIVGDDTAPVITCPSDIVANADAGLCTATVSPGTATATDNCGAAGPVSGVRDDGMALTDPYPTGVTTITWSVEDDAGNSDSCTQTITVDALNTVTATVVLDSVDAGALLSRCIKFVASDGASCTSEVSVLMDFSGDPATGIAIFDVDCGGWTDLCVKDEQHTLWDTVTLTTVGTEFATAPGGDAVLLAGDTDNDGDVDINDVTYFLFTFGSLAVTGSCPWTDTSLRDADFSNDGAVGSEDYTILAGSWLAFTFCDCGPGPATGIVDKPKQRMSTPVNNLPPEVRKRVDLDGNGVLDFKDVRMFERQNGLPSTLSSGMGGTP